MKRQDALAIVAIVVGLVAIAGVTVLFVSQPQQSTSSTTTTTTTAEPEVTYYNESTVFRIDESGNAEAEWTMEMSSSDFTDQNIIPIIGGTIGGIPVHGIGVENAKLIYLSSLQSSYSYFGFEMESASCEIGELHVGGPFSITVRWRVPHMAYRQSEKWVLLVEPVDKLGYAQHTLNNIKELQANISIVSKLTPGGCQLVDTYSTTYILPDGAEISNPEELTLLNYSIDYGGGTIEYDNAYISEVNGAPALVTEGQVTVGDSLVSITEEEYMAASESTPVEYTGVAPPEDFESSASWAAVDMKFGRQRDFYTVTFDGKEFNITSNQLLYYAAKKIVALAEDSGEPLLIGDQLIQVAPPDSESGDWWSFLQTLSMNDLAALARDVRDSIDATGKAPDSVDSPIGELRPRDALFTFLRAISFYHEHGNLPDELAFAPAPTGNLLISGFVIPANLTYLTLSGKYAVTGTPKVNQIISDLWRPDFSDSAFSENVCDWVNRRITYTLVLGYFSSEETLETGKGKCLDIANTYMAITRTAGLPTRLVTGFLIFSADQLGPTFLEIAGITPDGKYIVGHAWTEVYIPGEGWTFADPTAGYFKTHRYDANVYSQVEETWQEVLADYETTYGELI